MRERELIQELKKDGPLFDLARALALPVVVEPELLRRVRLRLIPGAGPELEARLWFSDLIETRSPRGLVFFSVIGQLLREELALDFALMERSWRIVQELHRDVTPALRVEEELRWWSHCGLPEADSRLNELLSSAALALVGAGREGLAPWAARALSRLPERVRDSEAARMLAAGASVRLSNSIDPRWLAVEEPPAWLPWTIPPDHPRVTIGLRFDGRLLEIGDPSWPDAFLLELPRIDPLRLQISWKSEDRTLKRTLLFRPGENLTESVEASTIALRTATGEQYELHAEMAGSEGVGSPATIAFEAERKRHRPYFGFERLARNLATATKPSFTVVAGGPGCGKTAFLCRVLDLAEEGGDGFVVHHFLGAEPDRRPILARAVENLCLQLELRLPALASPGQPPHLRLRTLLGEVSRVVLQPESKRLLVVLGGLQHAEDVQRTGRPLADYLPEELPPGVVFLVEIQASTEALSDDSSVIRIDGDDLLEERLKAFQEQTADLDLGPTVVSEAAQKSGGDLYLARFLRDRFESGQLPYVGPNKTALDLDSLLQWLVDYVGSLPIAVSPTRYLSPFCFVRGPIPLEMLNFLSGGGWTGPLTLLLPFVREVEPPTDALPKSADSDAESRGTVWLELHHPRLREVLRRTLPQASVDNARAEYFSIGQWPPPEELGAFGRSYVVRHLLGQMLEEERRVGGSLHSLVTNLDFLSALLTEKGPARFWDLMEAADVALGSLEYSETMIGVVAPVLEDLLAGLRNFLAQDRPKPKDLPSMVLNQILLRRQASEGPKDHPLPQNAKTPLRLTAVSLSASSMERRESRHTGRIEGCRFIARRRLLSWSADATLRIWDVESLKLQHTLRGGHQGPVACCDVLGPVAASGSLDGSVRLWNLGSGEKIATLCGHRGGVTDVRLAGPPGKSSPDRCVSTSSDGLVVLWDLESGKEVATIRREGAVLGRYDTKRGLLYTGRMDGEIDVVDISGGESRSFRDAHDSAVRGLEFWSGGRDLLSWSSDRTLALWDSQSGQRRSALRRHELGISTVQVVRREDSTESMAARWLAVSCGEDHLVCLWDLDNGELLREWKEHQGAVLCCGVDFYGGWLMTGGADRSIVARLINDFQTGRPDSEQSIRLHGHAGSVRALTSAGDLLVSGSDDGALMLWDLRENPPRPRELGTWRRSVNWLICGGEDHGGADSAA